ncbi:MULTISPECIES: hypothetical protein [unclassified Lysobacter]|uniref:hypothetical protein n=1 Tax=unclassified Lysobacter TaxID=2635362 RepID=UPI001C2335B3|nr:hypothetical protein [Lysobacter sp. MMG2]MBU8978091.1 hypothetical protein [Lysobacter sp. MMG2]
MNVHHLTLDHVSDDALMTRLYELARAGRQTVETAQIDAEVYARLMQTYGEAAPDTARVAA